MSLPSASVIVRAQDSRADLDQLLPLLRRQTVAAELIVVDSGSRDGSQAVAGRLADRLARLEPGTYTPGRALNRGVREARGEVLFAFSSHCRPPGDDWIEQALGHYRIEDVAATCGTLLRPDRTPMTDVFFQDGAHARAHPLWGFSNHASSFRRTAWQQAAFNEGVDASEDRLWAIAITARGWRIALDPALWVDQAHRYNRGALPFLRRERREVVALGAAVPLPAYPLTALAADWWGDIPQDRHSTVFHRFLNYRRAAGLLGKYLGYRAVSRIPR